LACFDTALAYPPYCPPQYGDVLCTLNRPVSGLKSGLLMPSQSGAPMAFYQFFFITVAGAALDFHEFPV